MASPPRSPRIRPGTSQRGYGAVHQERRRQVAPIVESGRAVCVRCGEPIDPGERWDLGHDDIDRTRYTGPEHARCNRATAARRQPVVRVVAIPPDDPERGIFYGPPDSDTGKPRPWSRPWFPWRDELRRE